MIGCKMYKKKNGDVYLFEIYNDYVDLYINSKFVERAEYSDKKFVKAMKDMKNVDTEIIKLIDKFC